MDNTTIICRCEEINQEEIEEAIQIGAETFDDIKRLTRCGMGPCQSKICMNLVSSIISEKTSHPLSQVPVPRLRIPLRPIQISTLATGSSNFSSVKSVMDEVELDERR
ncbi:(2Fe-2S)-binding protein [Pseudalkalibacillus decolorationis]|uniref:(2Fe-2S)-binding protein n=1 Tax=Pseudalkalibacillus decolorationis TaxID=163879 RepID=UPI0021479574|nr:(2Fe-2S)-binding protein [Pseudalkalibacillus decolorationis]